MLIVNPNNRLRTPLTAIEPPLWAGLIANYNNAQIIDAEAYDFTLEETERVIRLARQNDILIVVMGNNPSVSSTPKMPVAEALADRIKDLNVSFTGLHPVAVKYDKYSVVTKPFEGFPMMPWDRLPMEKYRAHNWHCLDGSSRSPYASIYTSLGCPFDCYYCNIHTLYGGHSVQFRPIRDIFKEVDILVSKYKVRNIKIWDELFALNEDRVWFIGDGLKDYGLNMWAYARLDTITQKMLKAMKRAGINWVAYGFESMKDKKFIHKTEEIVKMTKASGINIIANFMFGLPGVLPEDDWKSVFWAKKQLFEFVNFYTAMPYPGSQWFNDIKPVRDWDSFNQYACDRKEWANAVREVAFRDYFQNPEYVKMITKKFGAQAKGQIEEMLGWVR